MVMSEERPEARAPARSTVSAAIFCGGRSARMGVDKALLVDAEGRTLLERARDVLRPLAGEVVLCCGSKPRYENLGLPLVLDRREDGGPLAGLEAALLHTTARRVIVLACDMPLATAEVLSGLLAEAESRDLDACLLATPAGVEPLCGVYSRDCLGPVREALDLGRRRMTSFHDLPCVGRPLAVAAIPARDADSARNLNTPADWAHFQQGSR
jgi:molybdopterin-guanine dinucleotide biosynthesis protein A